MIIYNYDHENPWLQSRVSRPSRPSYFHRGSSISCSSREGSSTSTICYTPRRMTEASSSRDEKATSMTQPSPKSCAQSPIGTTMAQTNHCRSTLRQNSRPWTRDRPPPIPTEALLKLGIKLIELCGRIRLSCMRNIPICEHVRTSFGMWNGSRRMMCLQVRQSRTPSQTSKAERFQPHKDIQI